VYLGRDRFCQPAGGDPPPRDRTAYLVSDSRLTVTSIHLTTVSVHTRSDSALSEERSSHSISNI